MRAPRASALEAAIAKQMGWRHADDGEEQLQKCNNIHKPPPAAEMNVVRGNASTSNGGEGAKDGVKRRRETGGGGRVVRLGARKRRLVWWKSML